MNELVEQEGVFRRALATPGLLKSLTIIIYLQYISIYMSNFIYLNIYLKRDIS